MLAYLAILAPSTEWTGTAGKASAALDTVDQYCHAPLQGGQLFRRPPGRHLLIMRQIMPHEAHLLYLRIVLTDPDLVQCQLAVLTKLSGGGQSLSGLVIMYLEHTVTDLGEAVYEAHERVLLVPPDLEVDTML